MPNFYHLGICDDHHVLEAMDELLRICLQQKISDLHFEPQSTELVLRIRQDQQLMPYQKIPSPILKKIMQRFKVLAHLDITEQRLPQDGQVQWEDSQNLQAIPCRLSTCPTLYGEKLVVRLLSFHRLELSWETIGLNAYQRQCIEWHTQKADGLILINGATGSGKTTTLYTLLKHINNGRRNIVSIEDPIEIPFLGFTQVQVIPAIGFGLSETMRTVLRQDPDIIMIGEIRDSQTAQLALHAAQTGHLLLSSIHANSPLACIQRLYHLGVHHHDLVEHLQLIISQKMITQDLHTTVTFEILEITEEIQQLILQCSHPMQLWGKL